MSGSCDPSTGQRSRSPHSWFGDRTCRAGPPPLPYPLLCTWSPTYRLVSPPPWLHNLAACPTLPGPSSRLRTRLHHPSCSAPEGAPEAMGMCRGFGVALLCNCVEIAIKAYTTTPLSRCPHGAWDSLHGQSALNGLF